MNTEQTEVNLLVVKAFDSLRIPYFLGGSMASSVHGIYHATADADFVAAVRPCHAEPLAALGRAYLDEWARELGLTDLLRRAIEDAGLPPTVGSAG